MGLYKSAASVRACFGNGTDDVPLSGFLGLFEMRYATVPNKTFPQSYPKPGRDRSTAQLQFYRLSPQPALQHSIRLALYYYI